MLIAGANEFTLGGLALGAKVGITSAFSRGFGALDGGSFDSDGTMNGSIHVTAAETACYISWPLRAGDVICLITFSGGGGSSCLPVR
jgi:hypothetical protein